LVNCHFWFCQDLWHMLYKLRYKMASQFWQILNFFYNSSGKWTMNMTVNVRYVLGDYWIHELVLKHGWLVFHQDRNELMLLQGRFVNKVIYQNSLN
jgi:hypothetical protein